MSEDVVAALVRQNAALIDERNAAQARAAEAEARLADLTRCAEPYERVAEEARAVMDDIDSTTWVGGPQPYPKLRAALVTLDAARRELAAAIAALPEGGRDA